MIEPVNGASKQSKQSAPEQPDGPLKARLSMTRNPPLEHEVINFGLLLENPTCYGGYELKFEPEYLSLSS